MNAPAPNAAIIDTLAIEHAGMKIELPQDAVLRALLAKLGVGAAGITAPRPLPLIGAQWHGGLYAGLTVAENDPHELILLPGEFEGPWEKALAWAAEQGGELPSRFDQLVLWKNLKREFKDRWYWSCEPYAGDADYAWYQGFNYGGQGANRKGGDYLARAVRRVAIR